MDDQCSKCDAKCCRYFCLEIDTPETFEDFENIRWYLCHQGVTVHVDEGDWYLAVESPCRKLGRDGLCTIYEDRPKLCRSYSQENCDYTAGDYGYDEYFTEPEQILAYARKKLGKDKFRRQWNKMTGKARKKAKKKSKKKSKKKRETAGK